MLFLHTSHPVGDVKSFMVMLWLYLMATGCAVLTAFYLYKVDALFYFCTCSLSFLSLHPPFFLFDNSYFSASGDHPGPKNLGVFPEQTAWVPIYLVNTHTSKKSVRILKRLLTVGAEVCWQQVCSWDTLLTVLADACAHTHTHTSTVTVPLTLLVGLGWGWGKNE